MDRQRTLLDQGNFIFGHNDPSLCIKIVGQFGGLPLDALYLSGELVFPVLNPLPVLDPVHVTDQIGTMVVRRE